MNKIHTNNIIMKKKIIIHFSVSEFFLTFAQHLTVRINVRIHRERVGQGAVLVAFSLT